MHKAGLRTVSKLIPTCLLKRKIKAISFWLFDKKKLHQVFYWIFYKRLFYKHNIFTKNTH